MRLEEGGFDDTIRESEAVFARRLAHFPEGFLILVDEEDGGAAGYYCAERWPRLPPASAAAYELGGDPASRCAPDGTVLYTASMTVASERRGTGAGAYLFRAARARVFAAAPELRAETLVVRASWTAARRVYAAEGFRERAVLEGFFAAEKGGEGVVMERTLASACLPSYT